jgi:hypothetical protein
MKFITVVGFVLLAGFTPVMAQLAPADITVRGVVFDVADSSAKPTPIIVNRRTGTGQTASGTAMFSISGLRTDTFLVAAGGYEMTRICFRDSAVKSVYTIRVGLRMKENYMKPVAIYPVKDLEEIKKDREQLGAKETHSTVGLTDAVESPITFLYERFSREGQSRAAVAQMENADRQKEVLKDLFRTYVRAGVIDLEEEEFDSFIMFLSMPEAYLRTASDYDLAVTIRTRYLQYRNAQKMHNSNQR